MMLSLQALYKVYTMIVPVVLAGGVGSRLWPLSRASNPKQFLPFFNGKSLFQLTLVRATRVSDEAGIVLAHEDHRFLVEEQLNAEKLSTYQIVIEPTRRNTAPSVTVAVLKALALHDDPILFVMPSDHLIQDIENFKNTILKAKTRCEAGDIVTFGVMPDYPATSYGYIKKGQPIENGYKVAEFIEKPPLELAQQLFKEGNYYWNSGMFMFRAKSMLKMLEEFIPTTLNFCKQALGNAIKDLDFLRLQAEYFSECNDESLDYAVMEKIKNAIMFPLLTDWNDAGDWLTLARLGKEDSMRNVIEGDVVLQETENCYVRADSRLVATLGIKDCLVIETPDSVLVARKSRSQEIKQLVKKLEERQRREVVCSRQILRPWGHFEIIAESSQYIVKRILVKPQASLSLQLHHHRSEHWTIVEGEAEVICGDKYFRLRKN